MASAGHSPLSLIDTLLDQERPVDDVDSHIGDWNTIARRV